MTIVEITTTANELTPRQLWGHNVVVIFSILMFVVGINLRDSTLNATRSYTNLEAGIRAEYPQNWLIDSSGDYVFRVRDVSQIGYPTTIQISVRPVSAETPPRYLFDALTLNRSQTLASYSVLASALSFTLPDETEANAMQYTFVATGNNPFLQSVPIVVRGIDILTIRRGQAIIITFLSDSNSYDQNYAVFQRFISSLEF
ncbi:MAG: hypothetical protein ABI690_07155 [Chloroflexota bacterium]